MSEFRDHVKIIADQAGEAVAELSPIIPLGTHRTPLIILRSIRAQLDALVASDEREESAALAEVSERLVGTMANRDAIAASLNELYGGISSVLSEWPWGDSEHLSRARLQALIDRDLRTPVARCLHCDHLASWHDGTGCTFTVTAVGNPPVESLRCSCVTAGESFVAFATSADPDERSPRWLTAAAREAEAIAKELNVQAIGASEVIGAVRHIIADRDAARSALQRLSEGLIALGSNYHPGNAVDGALAIIRLLRECEQGIARLAKELNARGYETGTIGDGPHRACDLVKVALDALDERGGNRCKFCDHLVGEHGENGCLYALKGCNAEGSRFCPCLAVFAPYGDPEPVAIPLVDNAPEDLPRTELPGTWDSADFMGGQDVVRP